MEIFVLKISENINPSGSDYSSWNSNGNIPVANNPHLKKKLSSALIKCVISKKLGMEKKDITIDKNKYGKPFLKNYENFHFNVSHSVDWIVCAIDNKPLGIDIEKIKPIDIRTAESCFSAEEYSELIKLPEVEQINHFYNIWTLKESYIKNIGVGLSAQLKSFTIRLIKNKIFFFGLNPFKKNFFKQFEIEDGYKLSTCGLTNDFPKHLHRINNLTQFENQKTTY
jgi:4'-phosphopantetheinyl transferase